jgi:hypothetical protein
VIARLKLMAQEEVINEACLGQMDRNVALRVPTPVIVGAKEQLHLAHKVDAEVGL